MCKTDTQNRIDKNFFFKTYVVDTLSPRLSSRSKRPKHFYIGNTPIQPVLPRHSCEKAGCVNMALMTSHFSQHGHSATLAFSPIIILSERRRILCYINMGNVSIGYVKWCQLLYRFLLTFDLYGFIIDLYISFINCVITFGTFNTAGWGTGIANRRFEVSIRTILIFAIFLHTVI